MLMILLGVIMGLNTEKHNGSTICDLCYKDGEGYRNIGSLIYFRTHEAEVKLDLLPCRAWKIGREWFIGNFMPCEKVPEPPYIAGDIMATTDERGNPIKVGHVHTRDNETGETQYYLTLFGIPIGVWRKAIKESDEGGGRRSLFMRIKMEDGECSD